MSLKSAAEDLRGTTLKAINGLLAKLEYLSRLRAPNGSYQHWGFARVHGKVEAEQAFKAAHRLLLSRVLRTPLHELLQEVETSSELSGMEPEAYIEGLLGRYRRLLPPDAGPESEAHFNSVLAALAELLKARRVANRPTSSPPPPLAR